MKATPRPARRLGPCSTAALVLWLAPAAWAGDEAVFPSGADVAWISRGERVALEEHLVPGKVTVVDFWAEWCLPCREVDRQMAKILAESTDVALRKIDVVDWDSPVADQHLSRAGALPYLLVFDKTGKRIAVVEGLDLRRLRRAVAKARRSAAADSR